MDEPVRRSSIRRLASTVSRHSLFRFLASGGISVGIDIGLLYLLHGVLGVWLPLAAYLAVAFSFVVNFVLNRLWSFGSQRPAGRQLVKYLVLAAVNWIFTVISVSGLASLGLHYLGAKLVTVGIASMVNYVVYRFWVFR